MYGKKADGLTARPFIGRIKVEALVANINIKIGTQRPILAPSICDCIAWSTETEINTNSYRARWKLFESFKARAVPWAFRENLVSGASKQSMKIGNCISRKSKFKVVYHVFHISINFDTIFGFTTSVEVVKVRRYGFWWGVMKSEIKAKGCYICMMDLVLRFISWD